MSQLFLMAFFILIPLLFLFLNFIMSKKSMNYREKNAPFECGFDPMSSNHLPFSNQFFLISLIFMIFDIEITLLIPIIFIFNSFSPFSLFIAMTFILILMLGIFLEYSEYSIDWKF